MLGRSLLHPEVYERLVACGFNGRCALRCTAWWTMMMFAGLLVLLTSMDDAWATKVVQMQATALPLIALVVCVVFGHEAGMSCVVLAFLNAWACAIAHMCLIDGIDNAGAVATLIAAPTLAGLVARRGVAEVMFVISLVAFGVLAFAHEYIAPTDVALSHYFHAVVFGGVQGVAYLSVARIKEVAHTNAVSPCHVAAKEPVFVSVVNGDVVEASLKNAEPSPLSARGRTQCSSESMQAVPNALFGRDPSLAGTEISSDLGPLLDAKGAGDDLSDVRVVMLSDGTRVARGVFDAQGASPTGVPSLEVRRPTNPSPTELGQVEGRSPALDVMSRGGSEMCISEMTAPGSRMTQLEQDMPISPLSPYRRHQHSAALATATAAPQAACPICPTPSGSPQRGLARPPPQAPPSGDQRKLLSPLGAREMSLPRDISVGSLVSAPGAVLPRPGELKKTGSRVSFVGIDEGPLRRSASNRSIGSNDGELPQTPNRRFIGTSGRPDLGDLPVLKNLSSVSSNSRRVDDAQAQAVVRTPSGVSGISEITLGGDLTLSRSDRPGTAVVAQVEEPAPAGTRRKSKKKSTAGEGASPKPVPKRKGSEVPAGVGPKSTSETPPDNSALLSVTPPGTALEGNVNGNNAENITEPVVPEGDADDSLSATRTASRHRFSTSQHAKVRVKQNDVRTVEKTVHWKKGDLLGQGGFGKVFLGLNLDTGTLMAVKSIEFSSSDKQLKERLQQLALEIKIMSPLDHPHIVKHYFTERSGLMVNIFMEYVPGGSIFTILESFGKLAEDVVVQYTHQILLGLMHLHSMGIIHRDIKCCNVLLTVEGVCKLADFGASAIVDQGARVEGMQGTPFWMAPEVLRAEQHGWEADIWSLGCAVMEMLTAQQPWAHLELHNGLEVCKWICEQTDDVALPPELPVSCEVFLFDCLPRNANERFPAEELLYHPFFLEGAAELCEARKVELLKAKLSPGEVLSDGTGATQDDLALNSSLFRIDPLMKSTSGVIPSPQRAPSDAVQSPPLAPQKLRKGQQPPGIPPALSGACESPRRMSTAGSMRRPSLYPVAGAASGAASRRSRVSLVANLEASLAFEGSVRTFAALGPPSPSASQQRANLLTHLAVASPQSMSMAALPTFAPGPLQREISRFLEERVSKLPVRLQSQGALAGSLLSSEPNSGLHSPGSSCLRSPKMPGSGVTSGISDALSVTTPQQTSLLAVRPADGALDMWEECKASIEVPDDTPDNEKRHLHSLRSR